MLVRRRRFGGMLSARAAGERSSHATCTRYIARKEVAMRVELQTDGGIAYFPGLSKPVVVDSSDLPKEQSAQLKQLIASTRFFELPAASRSLPKGAADLRRYTITVEDG